MPFNGLRWIIQFRPYLDESMAAFRVESIVSSEGRLAFVEMKRPSGPMMRNRGMPLIVIASINLSPDVLYCCPIKLFEVSKN